MHKQQGARSSYVASPRLLVEIKDEICLPLTIIFQKSSKSGKVPSEWKLGNVTPIHKKTVADIQVTLDQSTTTQQQRPIADKVVLYVRILIIIL